MDSKGSRKFRTGRAETNPEKKQVNESLRAPSIQIFVIYIMAH